MLIALLSAAFLMGLAGGPHCLAMCGSVCTAMGQLGARRFGAFQAGRMLGYAALGALAGGFVQTLAWVSEHVLALKALWMLTQAVVLAWGLVLLMFARQPLWVERASGWVWSRVRSAGANEGRSLGLGLAWCLLPCGLLYSAVMLAGLSGSMGAGALVMLAFASATVLCLSCLPLAWQRLHAWRQSWGQRLAGLMLVITSAAALWMQLVHGVKLIC